MKRRCFLKSLVVAASAGMLNARAASPAIDVYKTATCGCCIEWVEHLQANGFKVNVNNVPDTGPYREKYGIPQALGSCHTATVQGYTLEGHVPAREIKRLLKERPKAAGLAVPGMPIGSPGMEVEGRTADSYDVLLVNASGKHAVYQRYK